TGSAALTASSLTVEAVLPLGRVNAFSANATSGAGAKDVGVAGALGLLVVRNETEAVLQAGARVTLNGGALRLLAGNASTHTAGSRPREGGASGSDAGIGASVGL